MAFTDPGFPFPSLFPLNVAMNNQEVISPLSVGFFLCEIWATARAHSFSRGLRAGCCPPGVPGRTTIRVLGQAAELRSIFRSDS